MASSGFACEKCSSFLCTAARRISASARRFTHCCAAAYRRIAHGRHRVVGVRVGAICLIRFRDAIVSPFRMLRISALSGHLSPHLCARRCRALRVARLSCAWHTTHHACHSRHLSSTRAFTSPLYFHAFYDRRACCLALVSLSRHPRMRSGWHPPTSRLRIAIEGHHRAAIGDQTIGSLRAHGRMAATLWLCRAARIILYGAATWTCRQLRHGAVVRPACGA